MRTEVAAKRSGPKAEPDPEIRLIAEANSGTVATEVVRRGLIDAATSPQPKLWTRSHRPGSLAPEGAALPVRLDVAIRNRSGSRCGQVRTRVAWLHAEAQNPMAHGRGALAGAAECAEAHSRRPIDPRPKARANRGCLPGPLVTLPVARHDGERPRAASPVRATRSRRTEPARLRPKTWVRGATTRRLRHGWGRPPKGGDHHQTRLGSRSSMKGSTRA